MNIHGARRAGRRRRKACRLWTGGGPQRAYSGRGGGILCRHAHSLFLCVIHLPLTLSITYSMLYLHALILEVPCLCLLDLLLFSSPFFCIQTPKAGSTLRWNAWFFLVHPVKERWARCLNLSPRPATWHAPSTSQRLAGLCSFCVSPRPATCCFNGLRLLMQYFFLDQPLN